ncbi:MmgE/PrpD family protein [Mesorhizobium sp. LHD-90]|uniref:MmgE/PrpD family protein n=1 Tax=Mesorhizobium sp. LHD-90 TaxID=3071414 RepID=UPI0027DEC789|nr:MmgE/PrpD family protein [Mesorhizobium sp. LHD-90]MDQ6433205.1 MmgE/PrpD family protein [Mesorhizobium sp. LHD-90]
MAAGNDGSKNRPAIDFSEEFARFAATVEVKDLAPEVVEAAKANIFDTMACAAGGISGAGVRDLAGLVADWGGKPEASVWFTDIRVPAPMAAWVNGMMSHARDFDDTLDAATLHAGVSVIPAAVAAAETAPEATGEDLIAGVAVGLELISRLGLATRVGIIESGYMYTSLFGHFAATAAAARVMRLDAAQTRNALGIAYSQAAGNHQVTRDAALTKRIQPGFAAKTGLISVAMSKLGIRGAQMTFEGVDGLFRTYLHDRYDPERLRQGLGSQFEFAALSYKPYPCCRFNHTAIDAALVLREKLGGDLSDIRAIRVGVNNQSYEAVCTPPEMRRAPKTIVQAQFSIPYTFATALVTGGVNLNDLSDEALNRPDVLALAAKTECRVDLGIEADWPRAVSPADVEIETVRGTFSMRVDYPKGHPDAPMSERDFDMKMEGCLAASGLAWPEDTVRRFRTRVDGLAQARRGAEILDVFVMRK